MDDRLTIGKSPNYSGESEAINKLAGKIARYLIQNNTSQRFLQDALTEIIESWGKNSRVKNTLTKPVLRTIAQGWPDHGSQSNRLQDIEDSLQQQSTVLELSQKIPVLVNLALDICEDISRALAEADPEQKSRILAHSLSQIRPEMLGSIISDLAKSLQDIHQQDPEILSRELGPHIENLIQNSDIGQLKESIQESEQDILKIVEILNQSLWEHPAKAISLLSILPLLLNTAIKSLDKTLQPLQNIPPDVFADVVLALSRDLNPQALAQTANQFLEIVRKFHTGSELMGEQNNPMLNQVLEQFIHEFLHELDSELLISSGNKLQEIKESLHRSASQELDNNPELADRYLQSKFQGISRRSGETSAKLDMLENLQQNRDLNQLLGSYLDEIDSAQPAENLNRIFTLINDAHSQDPEMIPEFCEQFLSSLDENEIKDIWLLFSDTILKHNQGLVYTILPSMINTLADMLSRPEAPRDELAKSVLNLKNAIQNLEVDS